VEFNEDKGNVNLLVWRKTADDWQTSAQVVALTSTFYDPITGEIYDADIEFNDFYYEFGAQTSYPPSTTVIDLQSTTTHEIGHMLGFDHSAVPGATMDPFTDAGSTQKRSLAQDDIDALCTVYPLEEDPEVCREPHCGLDLSGQSTSCIIAAAEDDGCGCHLPGVIAKPPAGVLQGLISFAESLYQTRLR
jgi:hypothetical protein